MSVHVSGIHTFLVSPSYSHLPIHTRLYGDGMSLDAKEYNKRKKELSALTQPIFLR